MAYGQLTGKYGRCEDIAASVTIDSSYYGGFYTVSAAATITLPNPTATPPGVWLDFILTADEDVAFTTTADKLIAPNDAAATTVTLGTTAEQIGAGVRLVCVGVAGASVGTKWALLLFTNEAVTPTIA